MARPKQVEPSLTYNLIIRERQMKILREQAHRERVSVAEIIRRLLDETICGDKASQ